MNYKKLSVWLVIIGVLIIVIVYGLSFLSEPEQLAFRELAKNLAEIELKPEKDTLEALNKKVNEGKTLTEKEKREAMAAEEKIRSVRKEYSEGKLAPPPKPAFAKPKTKWVARLSANRRQIEEAAKNLIKLRQKVDTEKMNPPAFLMVLTGGNVAYQRPDGVLVVPIGSLKD